MPITRSCSLFRFLDTDRNGRVSKEEWRVGVELLNRRLLPISTSLSTQTVSSLSWTWTAVASSSG